MKKTAKTILTLALALAFIFGIAACGEVEGGSKIQRMKMQIEFLDASGEVADTQTVTIKLYLNYAPETTKHFMELAESGYYDGTVVSHVAATWFEFGGYSMEDGKLAKKDQGEAIEGEFTDNGWTGNTLRPTAGALILKRNYDATDGSGASQFNTGKATIIMCTGTTSKFDPDRYCVFGMVVSDDATAADNTASESASDSTVNRDGMSSLEKIKTIADLAANADGDKVYYNEKDNAYFALVHDADGEAHYYKGMDDGSDEMTDEETEDFTTRLDEESNDFLVLPYLTVRIKSIKKA